MSKLVFIGKNLDHDALKRSFEACLATPENMRLALEKRRVTELGSRFMSSTQKNDVAKLEELIKAGVPVGFANGVKQTALHVAALWGNIEAATVLISHGAPLNVQNSLSGATPLHMVAGSSKDYAGRLKCAELIIAAGADLTVQDFGGRTAWQAAADAPAEQKELEALLRPAGKVPELEKGAAGMSL